MSTTSEMDDPTNLPLFEESTAHNQGTDPAPGTAPAPGEMVHPTSPAATTRRNRRNQEPTTRAPHQAHSSRFWQHVAQLRAAASPRLADTVSDGQRREPEQVRAIIEQIVKDHVAGLIRGDGEPWDEDYSRQIKAALFDDLVGLGRLQPLVDDPEVENVAVYGHDHVLLKLANGDRVQGPPVAISDKELISNLQQLADRQGRSFAQGSPFLDLALPGKVRLHASHPHITQGVPIVNLRIHRFADATLAKLRELGELDVILEEFLAAAVQAGKSIVVSGKRQGSGKALALDTPVPTPSGWTTMGALRAGDEVFDETGKPCTVLAAHDVQHGRECFEMTFDDGTTVTADADHLWRVTRRAHRKSVQARKQPRYALPSAERERLWEISRQADLRPDEQITIAKACELVGPFHRYMLYEVARHLAPGGQVRAGTRDAHTYSRQTLLKQLALTRDTAIRTRTPLPEAEVLSTRSLSESPLWTHDEANWRTHDFAIEVADAVQYPRRHLPLDPYLLGIWLGDGAAGQARISTTDPEVLDAFTDAGYTWAKIAGDGVDYGISNGLITHLRGLGLVRNKHIPDIYMCASAQQRLALLQGLMDADGHCTPSGTAEFYTTKRRLAAQASELAASLGFKPSTRSKAAVLEGRDCGDCWTVTWTTATPVFRLPRKVRRQQNNHGGPHTRHIVSVRPVPPVPVRCITVDSPSSLYLVTRAYVPTHNTTLLRALAREIPPSEKIVTIETEYELYLHEDVDHPEVVALEAKPWTGEFTPDGKRSGEVTTEHLAWGSLRENADRVIVGEARSSAEVGALVDVMQHGGGSMSTIHADNARTVIDRLVDFVGQYTGSYEYASRLVSRLFHLVVFIGTDIDANGRKHRYISEVLEVQAGESNHPSGHPVFTPDADGKAVPNLAPSFIDDLVAAGFDQSLFNHHPGGLWPSAGEGTA